MTTDRRRFMRGGAVTLATFGSGLGAIGCARDERSQQTEDRLDAQGKTSPPFRPLEEGDRVDLGDRAESAIETANQLGRRLSKEHGGCARCTVAALQKAIEFVPEDKGLFRAASCLSGGATPHGLQNCGAFTGAGMFLGWTCGTDGFQSTRLSNTLIREVYQRFEDHYGSVLCKDVRREANGDCAEVVANAAQWTAEVLLAQFADFRTPADQPVQAGGLA